eukprot:2124382-Prymnesium_polylepis.1
MYSPTCPSVRTTRTTLLATAGVPARPPSARPAVNVSRGENFRHSRCELIPRRPYAPRPSIVPPST